MAKRKKAIDRDGMYADLAEETDADILADLDSVKYFIDTGSLAFNYSCSGNFIGGGIPGEKITEIYGPSSSGKSLIANNVLYGCQKLDGWAIILDTENSTNKEFMERASHVNPKRVLRKTPMTLERAFSAIHNMCRKIREKEKAEKAERKPIVFVYDSISVSPCEREFREVDLPEDYKPADWKKIVGAKEQPGERAKVCSREFRKLGSHLEKYGATLVVINQTREKIGVMYGNPETTGGGGNALPFYSSCRLRTAQKKKIENKKLETYAGVNMHVRNVKNKTFRPFVEAQDIKLYFNTGVDPVSGLLKCLIQDERINMYASARFEVYPEFLPDGKDEYKFQAKKTTNEMSTEIIMDCPKLVGAETREEVEEYLHSFGAAMACSKSEDFEEKFASFDEDGNPLDPMAYDAYDEVGEEEPKE
jgi:recombination protein RecA